MYQQLASGLPVNSKSGQTGEKVLKKLHFLEMLNGHIYIT